MRVFMKYFFIQTLRDILLPQIIKHMASSGGSKISLSLSSAKTSAEYDDVIFECLYDGASKEFPTINVLKEAFELFKERKLVAGAILEILKTSTGRLTICDFQRNSVKSGRKMEESPERSGTRLTFSVKAPLAELTDFITENDLRLYIGYLLSTERLQERRFGILCTFKVFEQQLSTVSFTCPEDQIDALLFAEKESKEKVTLCTPEYSLLKLKDKDVHKLYVCAFGPEEGVIHPCYMEGKYEEFWKSVTKELNIDFTELSYFSPRVCAETPKADGSYFLLVHSDFSKEVLSNVLGIIKTVNSGSTFDENVIIEEGKSVAEEKEEGNDDEITTYIGSVAESIASIITMSQNTDFRMKALMLIHGRLVPDTEINEDQIKAAIINLFK